MVWHPGKRPDRPTRSIPNSRAVGTEAGRCRLALGSLILIGTLVGRADAQSAVSQQFDVRVPMRDGVTLSADIWLPATPGRYPTVLTRTPYIKARAGMAKLAHAYASRGYVFVAQDTRGRGDSDGRFSWLQDDANDGYDTVEWIAARPWSNGRVGMTGGSYVGSVQWLAARERPPHLTCLLPKAAAGRWFDETPYLGGAFLMGFALSWANLTSGRISQEPNMELIDWEPIYRHRPLASMDSAMGRRMPVYQSWLRHPTFDDYWRRITLTDTDFARIDVPAFTVTGWFDADQSGALHYWRGMRKSSPARDKQYLLIGPWQHVATIYGHSPTRLGELEFSSESVVDVQANDFRWFDACLEGTGELAAPRARIYLTGINQWRDLDDYPPPEASVRRLYLHSGGHANRFSGDGTLDWTAPRSAEPTDHYSYDPTAPIPIAEVQEDGVDQRHLESRDDVLVYTSAPLDQAVTVVGKVFVELQAATDARDTDFMAKIMDVYPDGRAPKLGSKTVGVRRARYRNGYDREELVRPGVVETYRIELFDLGHVFLPGHRIRIDISSSASPAVAPHSHTGNPIATDTAWTVAHQTIYHDRGHQSFVLLPVMPSTEPPARW